GMGAYGATPFKMQGGATSFANLASSYINSVDGYLYAAGSNHHGQFGIGSGGTGTSGGMTSFVKVGTTTTGGSPGGFKNPIDYSFGSGGMSGASDSYTSGIVVDSSGKVWTAGYNGNYALGLGSTSTYPASSSYYYFRTVATSNSGNYLPANYQAVAVSSSGENGSQANLILTSTGALYGAGQSSFLGGAATTTGYFVRLDGVVSNLPAATTSNKIVDFSCGYQCSYVLYSNGDLYRLGSSAILAAKNITMFDVESGNSSTYVRAVNSSNKILYRAGSSTTVATASSPSNGWTTVTPTGTVTQIRGAITGWGYLNSAGALYLSSTDTGTPSTSSSYNSGVTYFDLAGSGPSYGIIQNGVTKFWGGNYHGGLGNGSTGTVSVSSPFTPSNVDTSYYVQTPTGPGDISNSPPAFS
ncbi:MAG: hypothetical protein R3Y05_06750, partial [bacterium]